MAWENYCNFIVKQSVLSDERKFWLTHCPVLLSSYLCLEASPLPIARQSGWSCLSGGPAKLRGLHVSSPETWGPIIIEADWY